MNNNPNTNKLLISTAYLGSVEYFAFIVQNEKAIIDSGEHYIKQTYRNRCEIYATSGKLSLIIPVIKVNGNHTKIKDIRIAYTEQWQKVHWRAIVSAYNQSPFFLYYRDELEGFYLNTFDYLLDFNLKITETVLNLIGIDNMIEKSVGYIEKNDSDRLDLRNHFSPKKKPATVMPEYVQVFSDKQGFIPNLSIIDLLFNEGPNACDYLEILNLH